ncbi:MAG TPA: hypothetical protein VFV24_03355 [Candidatus Eisenbacteria bacterium]|nr:hypothetical protein [Candidatus Eisenbacteria bacterium]
MKTSERGFALVAVLLVLALLGALGAEFAYTMRLEASSVRAYKDTVIATHLAEAALAQARSEILNDYNFVCLAEDGEVSFFMRDGTSVPRYARKKVPLGSGQYSYTIDDEDRFMNLNTSRPDRVDRLLQLLGLEKTDRDVIVDSIQDWRDANEDHRVNGAESEDTYLKRAVPYRSRNRNLESVRELLQIKGITPALFYGTEGRPGLVHAVTVRGSGRINVNTADPLVLRALALSDAEIETFLQMRKSSCFTTLPTIGTIAGRGFVLTSRTFRVTAEGLIDGQVRARITAVLQKGGSDGGVNVLDWSADEASPKSSDTTPAHASATRT